MSASATGNLEADTVTATAGDAGSDSPAPLTKNVLVHATPNGNLITLSRSAGVTVDTTNGLPYATWVPGDHDFYYSGGANGYTSANASAKITADANIDSQNREVTISSSLGQTNHKGGATTDNGSPQVVPDVPDASGTVNANTLKPTSQSTFDGSPTSIDYYAHPAGSWAANSSYHWNIAEGDGGTNPPDGTFTMPGDPPYSNGAGYYTGSISGGPEHVYIHLTDAADGANGTANYYVNWHDPVEKWVVNGSSVSMPPTPYGDSKVSQPAGGQDTVEIDVPPGKVSGTSGDKVLGGVLTTGAAVIAVAFPETDPVLLGLITAAGYTLSVEPDPADQSYKISGPESQFQADVATQIAINNGNTSGVFRPDLQRMDKTLAQAISQSGDYVNYFNGKYGPMSFGVQIFRLQWSQNYLGDAYGITGYTGTAPGVVNWPGSIPPSDYVFNWTKA